MRDSFIFYRHYYEALKDLPRDIQGEIYTAIMEYGLYGNETDNLKPIASSIFKLIKPNLESDYRRFENGCKGGRPKKILQKEKTELKPNQNLEITKEKPKENLAKTKVLAENQPYYINNNINNNLDNIIERKEDISLDISKKRKNTAAIDYSVPIEERKKAFYDTIKPFVGKYPNGMLRSFFDYWSEMNQKRTKMRYEIELETKKTWEIGKRLARWANNNKVSFAPSTEIGTILHDNGTEKYENESRWER